MSKIRNIIKRISQPFLKTGLDFYYRKPRKYSYQNIEVLVHPEVFPTHLTLSTKILLDFINSIDLNNKSLLELGCGSGIISLLASKKGATVTASDINKIALDYLKQAAVSNKLEVTCVYSNLFENLIGSTFNYIIINPPYYPKTPTSIKEQAWFCGEDFQYFKDLFKQLPTYPIKETTVYMILSQDCDLNTISMLAKQQGLSLGSVFQTKKLGEENTIYTITRNDR